MVTLSHLAVIWCSLSSFDVQLMPVTDVTAVPIMFLGQSNACLNSQLRLGRIG